jgi:hypothetical protein
MKRILLWISAIILALGLAAYVVCDLFLGSIVKAGVNRFAPMLTQTKVQLADAQISPLTGAGTLSGLVIGNPGGWSDRPAMALKKVHVEVAPSSLMGDHIIVKDIEIEGPDFNYETKVVSSNIGDLLNHLESVSSGSGTGGETVTRNGRPIRFEVKHLRITGGQVRLGVGPTALMLPMPPIELNNLGTAEGGITANQLAFAIMRSVTANIVATTTQAMGQVGATMGAAVGDKARKALDGLKGLFGGKN